MEKFFEWKDAYSVGVDEIDDQHRNLVEMVNQLHDHLNEDSSMRLYIEVFLERLVSYVEYHFACEERTMVESNYPDYEAHLKIHNALRAQVSEFKQKFINNEADVSESLMEFLKDWLLNHIGGMDQKVGTHLKAKGFNRNSREDLANVLDEFNKAKKKA